MYVGVPQKVWNSVSCRNYSAMADRPYSNTLRSPASSMRRFSILISWWYTPRTWKKVTANTSSWK
jgi:hypothetical protein